MSAARGRCVHHEMPTPAERKALVFLSSVIFLGAGTRVCRSAVESRNADQSSSKALRNQIAAVDSVIAQRNSGAKRGRKVRPGKGAPANPPPVPAIIDMDLAKADQIETLRGIGPALAARIVADRDSFGAFGSLDGLKRVRGVGIALAEKLAPHVTFSGVPRPVNTVVSRRSVNKVPKRKSRRRPEVY